LIIIVLSYLKPFFPPRIVAKAPESVDRDDLKQIPMLIDLYEDGFFKHMFSSFKTANLLFDIDSSYSRTKKERLLISIVYDNKSNLNTELAHELLKGFVEEFNKISDVYKAFYFKSNIYAGDKNKFDEIVQLLNTFHTSFPEQEVIFEQKEAKILIFGLFLAGKTTIIRCRRKSVSKTIFPTISVDISRILVNNVSLLTYDVPGQSKFKNLWKPYLKDQDGLIFVLDVHDKIKFPDARALLHEIAGKPEFAELPLLVLFNKIDLGLPDIDELVEAMSLKRFGNRPLKYFLTSGVKNKNIDTAFNWLSLKIAERVESFTPSSDVGIIFCRWDENLGVKVEAIHPEDAFVDAELISVKSFAMSQVIFGRGQFERASLILPFPHLNSNAAIYFDYLEDESIRGGLLPISIIVYYNENIPQVIINQFNGFIFEQFEIIKQNYQNKEELLNHLKEIQKTIINQIDIYKPSIDVLKIAEVRYSTLFKAAQDTILIIDRKSGIILDANKKAEDLFELPSEDFIGLHASQLLIDEMGTNFKIKIFENIGNSTPIMLNIISQSGNIIPVEITVNEVQMGDQVLVQCIIRDISKRIETELKLMDSEIRYRHLFEESPYGILLMNPKGIIVDCNPVIKNLFGYEREELIGKKFINLPIIHEDFLVTFLKRFKEEATETCFPPIDIQIVQKNKNMIWITLQNSFVKIGKETYYQVICYDISEQKKAERELKKILKLEAIIARIISRFVGIKDFNRAIFDSLKDIGEYTNARRAYFFCFNQDYTFVEKNITWHAQILPPAIEIPTNLLIVNFPWLSEKMRNSDLLLINEVKDLPDEAMKFKTFLESQKIWNCVIYSIKINDVLEGVILFANFSSNFMWKEENFEFLGFFSEILKNTVLRELKKENLRKSEESFHREFDREYFYRELFVTDVKKILDNIQISIDKLSKQTDMVNSGIGKEILNNIKQQNVNGKQLLSIIQKLTLLNDITISTKNVNLKEELDKAINYIISSYTNKKINIVFEAPSEDVYVKADEFLVDIFTNLLFSSIRYNQDTSIELKIIVYRHQENDKKLIKIEFIDYKKAISNIGKEEILKMERKKDSKIKEILLGFLLVQRILDNYGGKIWVEGDSFVVLIPEIYD